MNELTTFTYAAGVDLRTATDADGETIVCLADLAKGLGIRNASQLRSRLPEGVCRTYTLSTPGGPQSMLMVTEAGMNMVIWRSDKPEAIAYARWCAERIAELRRHGLTATPAMAEAILNDPDVMIRILTELKAERAARAEVEAQAAAQSAELEAARPKALFADAVACSDTEILVGELAKILKGNGVHQAGGTRLFKWLRRKGYPIKRPGADWNMPTQRSMELGLFRIKETAVTHSDGHVSISKTPKVTGKGQVYFVEGFLSGRFSAEELTMGAAA